MTIKEDFELQLPRYKVKELDDCYVIETVRESDKAQIGMNIQKTPGLAEDWYFQSVIKQIRTAFAKEGV